MFADDQAKHRSRMIEHYRIHQDMTEVANREESGKEEGAKDLMERQY
ncbi:MAG TPA: hypothetical protein VJR48_00260 [Ktedonobacterales bacterium]|nr:hypothetical protein [Ktedonobacterales bacterium]